jgi:hypothetical protein
MDPLTKASLLELRELIRKEKDPSKLLELVQEINRRLEDKLQIKWRIAC